MEDVRAARAGDDHARLFLKTGLVRDDLPKEVVEMGSVH